MPSKWVIWICKLFPSVPDGKQHATKNRHTEAPLIKISSQDLLSGLQPLSTKEQAIYCICVSNSTEMLSQAGKVEKNTCLIVFSCLPVRMFHFKRGELFPYSWADLQECLISVIFPTSLINFLTFWSAAMRKVLHVLKVFQIKKAMLFFQIKLQFTFTTYVTVRNAVNWD